MGKRNWSRREMLGASAGSLAATLFAEPLKAATPAPSAVTPDLIEAARKEGKISYYAAIEINVAERLGKLFEAKYPGITVRVERSGAERIFQRIAQEQGSQIHAVDVANSTDVSHYLEWKKNGWLASYLPEEVVKHFPADQFDPDGLYATSCAWFETIGYNTKLVKGHPSYSGAILTTTYILSRELGWPYLEKLAQQKVMQVQSAGDPPRKIALGERAVMADGNDYSVILFKDQGKPVEVVYPAEGSPLIIVPSGVFESAPNPNAARLFQSFFFSREAQQMLVDEFAHRSFHDEVKPRAGQKPMSEVKMLKSDPIAVQAQSEEIKARYAKVFRV
jgi:iron(III) transport system substrate-binding protein